MLNNIVVYHASYTIINSIDLSFSKPNKDFGSGFYVTTDHSQAVKYAHIISKRKRIDTSYINCYLLSDLDNLKVLEFQSADIEWLKCISTYRNTNIINTNNTYQAKDVIIGKVADDNTNLVLNAYIRGAFGDINDIQVMELVIKRLMTEKLTDQICFKTTNSINKLSYINSEVINVNK